MIDLPAEGISIDELVKYLNEKLAPEWDTVRVQLAGLEAWARGRQPEPRVIRNTERKALQELSRMPVMRLMVSTFAQQLQIDGYRKAGSNENAAAWDTWMRNNMPGQQLSLNRSIITYGYAYVKVTKGTAPDSNETMAVMRARSPMKVFALYEDAYGDQWPKYVLEKNGDGTYTWWNDEEKIELVKDGGKFKYKSSENHDYAEVPFIRYVNEIDLDGRCWGDVEPLIELAKSIDKTKFDRLLVQHFNSFKVRWATGLTQPDREVDIEQEKIRISNDEILISSVAEAKFGTLEETTMSGFIEAYRTDLEAFLVAAQLPTSLAGQIVNVAADALAQANRPTVLKLQEKQVTYGQSHDQTMRFVNLIEGRADEAFDWTFQVHWRDVEVRSLAQFADAWGKMVESLKIPAWGVWDMIPGIDQSVIEGWKKDYMSNDPVIKYIRELDEKPEPAGAFGGTPGQKGKPGGPTASNPQKVNNKNSEPKTKTVAK